MAARADSMAGPEIVDLRRLAARALDPLLVTETAEWSRELDWDFTHSAELVRRYAGMHALGGGALMERGSVRGYGYTVLEDRKGLIGDLYIRPEWRDGEMEARVFRHLMEGMLAARITRMECQLMLMSAEAARLVQKSLFVRTFERTLMRADAGDAGGRPDPRVSRFEFARWGEHHHDDAAHVITRAYQDHVDSQINDQYRTFGGARRFLENIVRYPGCGEFFQPASWMAYESANGQPAGVVLTSFVAPEVAHITQLCVVPNAQQTGLGSELLRRAREDVRQHGAKRVSLTVTVRNTGALDLYRRRGFRDLRNFFAFVWDAPPVS
jgi:ribosomal protein S18 acetylase RimI-like enzyme